MRFSRLAAWVVATTVCLAGNLIAGSAAAADDKAATQAAAPVSHKLDNASCESCHDGRKGKLEVPGSHGEKRALYEVKQDKYAKSVHSRMQCIACHKEITDAVAPHQKAPDAKKVDCAQCHLDLWEAAKQKDKTQEKLRLGIVVENVAAYNKSFHAKVNKDDPGKVNATCNDCHNVHSFNVPPRGTVERKEWHLTVPHVCGDKCHTDELADWTASAHGKEVTEKHNVKSAVCSDCHSTHSVADPTKDAGKLAITANCGGCHAENLKTYTKTYHGQVNTLGATHTAKCFDCHGSHSIQPSTDPKSKLHENNRLKTCQNCHKGATKGFTKFEPHGTSHDFVRYPFIWLAAKFMLLFLGGIFAFFWAHTALWFYREYKERHERKPSPHVTTDQLLEGKLKDKHFRRFPLIWRIAHLTLAVSLMMLTLTGMSVLYADTVWAPVVMGLLGGPKVAAVIHHFFATLLGIVVVLQLVYFAIHIVSNRKTFDWFGPNSLVPRRQDLWDILAMVKWFFGLGPRPVFDRWTYWEKFDYWAPFAAVILIGATGVMLLFPNVTAAFLPGWVFNVATIFHGEEALLAALFVFTVHFFNNHYRPDKFPLDVVMFTGSMRLELFRSEHRAEYNRLVASGELEKYLVDAPSQPMTWGAKILGFALVGFGLLLLVLVLSGIFGT
ncbi:MAG: cytochrome C [Rhodocyclales bacterium]|nr:cytochrome C [Rhodocyclales bacterium]